jgi:hypothetical protein
VSDLGSIASPISLPSPTKTPDYGSTIISNNTALGADQDGIFQPEEVKQPDANQPTANTAEAYLTAVGIPIPPKQESIADAYLKAEKQYGIKEKQQQVNNYTAQLNAIVAKSQADQLAVTGQGRGIPEVIIGGQQAQIAKEAAILALPIQAQLAAAQGNLEMAEERLDTYYKVVSQDIQNKYNYDMKLYDTVYDYATRQQQIKLDEKKADKEFARQKELLALQFSYDKIKSGWSGGGAPTIKQINGVDYQWNGSQWIPANIAGGQAVDTKASDQIQFIRDTITGAKDLSGASGKGLWDRAAGWIFGSSKYNQLEAKADTIKTNILTLSTDPTIRKFFGPQMTNRDVELMVSAGTTLNPEKNTPDQLKTELQRYDDLLNRMQTAVSQGITGGGNVITAPDGTLVEIIN